MQKLITIIGPTGSGKSGLAIKLAKIFNGEIVNADSRQVYREMSVATAKPCWDREGGGGLKTSATQAAVAETFRFPQPTTCVGMPHHCFDLVDPDQPFTLADWKQCALGAIRDIHARGKTPILVGGTGLYVQSVVENLDIPQVPPNPTLRATLEAKSKIELLRELEARDPETAKTIDHHNKRRMVRALEVIEATGKPFSLLRRRGPKLFEVLQIGIDMPTKDLYARIDARVDDMVQKGLLDEVRRLVAKYPLDLPAMSGIGYRELAHRIGPMGPPGPIQDAIQKMKFRTHAFARRQLTWFRRDSAIHWVKTDEEAEAFIRDFLPSRRGGGV